MKKFNCKKISYLILILFQLAVCVYFGQQKRTYFCDETYSYGLANSEEFTFVDHDTAQSFSTNNGWVTEDFFISYVEVDMNTPFSLRAAYMNQVNDVHPPLYYILLHIFCYIFGGSFSKRAGISLNLTILLLIDAVLYYICNYFYRNNKAKSIMTILLWSLSAAGLSNILFIRMYLLLTFEILLYIATHIYGVKHQFNVYFIIFLYASVILGGLTHYYFYPFAFFFSAPICIWLLINHKIKNFLMYTLTLCGGFISNLLIFPATLSHVFSGYRGSEAFSNLENRSENVFELYYSKVINNSIFAGMFKLFVIIAIIAVIYKLFNYFVKIDLILINNNIEFSIERIHDLKFYTHKHNVKIYGSSIIYALTSCAIVGYAYISIVGSSLISSRYIYPIYPIVAMWIVSFISWIMAIFCTNGIMIKVISYFVVLLLCFGSVKKYGIDFSYKEYPEYARQAEIAKGYDCLLYFGDVWWDIYTAYPLHFIYDETYLFNNADIDNLNEILDYRETKDNVVVCLSDGYNDEQTSNILNHIVDTTEYTDYECVYRYYMQVYLLK